MGDSLHQGGPLAGELGAPLVVPAFARGGDFLFQSALVEEMLPIVSVPESGPLDAQTLFGDDRPLEFEIGFGGAEHLLWQARANPHVGLIGCEPFEDGVVKALSAIEHDKLDNIRLHADDARPLLRWLPDASSSTVTACILSPSTATATGRCRSSSVIRPDARYGASIS